MKLASHFAQLLSADVLAGNWADYEGYRHNPDALVYCGWMDLHHDKDNGVRETGRLWGIQPLFWDEDAVFVHTLPKALGGGLQVVERTDEVIFFRADLRHALVPRAHLDAILRRRSTKHIGMDWSLDVPPKLVWRWVCSRTGQLYAWAPLSKDVVAGWTPVSQPCRMPCQLSTEHTSP